MPASKALGLMSEKKITSLLVVSEKEKNKKWKIKRDNPYSFFITERFKLIMTRKYKLRVIQISLIVIGISIIYYTYYKETKLNEPFITTQKQKEIKEKIAIQSDGDVFTNIEYAGIHVSPNRYRL